LSIWEHWTRQMHAHICMRRTVEDNLLCAHRYAI
jgi:hypothetical protein